VPKHYFSLYAFAMALGLTACAIPSEAPLPGDMVNGAEAAIQIAKKDCKEDGRIKGIWAAALKNRIWTVAFDIGAAVPFYSVTVVAENGEVLSHCVVTVNMR